MLRFFREIFSSSKCSPVHVECSSSNRDENLLLSSNCPTFWLISRNGFDNRARNIPQQQNIGTRRPKTFEKLFSFGEICCSSKCSSTRVKFSFDNSAEIFALKVLKKPFIEFRNGQQEGNLIKKISKWCSGDVAPF